MAGEASKRKLPRSFMNVFRYPSMKELCHDVRITVYGQIDSGQTEAENIDQPGGTAKGQGYAGCRQQRQADQNVEKQGQKQA